MDYYYKRFQWTILFSFVNNKLLYLLHMIKFNHKKKMCINFELTSSQQLSLVVLPLAKKTWTNVKNIYILWYLLIKVWKYLWGNSYQIHKVQTSKFNKAKNKNSQTHLWFYINEILRRSNLYRSRLCWWIYLRCTMKIG